jgi:long-subunit fatty acid transport protein
MAPAAAQPFTAPRVDFEFSNPGARSLGFGGAFAALADDATAAFANPAGLVQLVRPEVSVEGRVWRRSPSFLAGGRVEGQPTGQGIDTDAGIRFGRARSQAAGPSFAALVIPKGRWSFALYGHQLARFEIESEFQGFFFTGEDCDGCFSFLDGRSPASQERVDLKIATAGFAAGWQAHERWSFGLGIVYSDVSLTTEGAFFLPDDDSPASQFAAVSFLPERLFSTNRLLLEGNDITVNAGVLWNPTDRLSAGLFYRQGAAVDGIADLTTGPVLGEIFTLQNRAALSVPDVWGGGLAYRSHDGRVTIAAEVDRVGYEGLIRVVDDEGVLVDGREYRDATEYHLGSEYAVLEWRPVVAFRLGVWREHNGADLLRQDVDHLAVGVGVAGQILQLDVGVDLSKEGDIGSISLIYSF